MRGRDEGPATRPPAGTRRSRIGGIGTWARAVGAIALVLAIAAPVRAQDRVVAPEGREAAPPGPTAVRSIADRPRVALVLSGGGARGFAHIGVLKVLEELRVPVDLVTGTSMGAIVGGAYAAGYTPEALERLVTSTDWDSIFAKRAPRDEMSWRRKEDDYRNLSDFEFGIKRDGLTLPRGLAGTQRLELFLRALGGPAKEVRDLGALPLPFTAMATDLATGKGVELQADISLSAAMRASMAVPGVFPPLEYRGRVLVDGGIVDNLPVTAARRRGADIVIAVNVGTPLLPRDKLGSVVSVADQLSRILGIESVERAIATLGERDILISPEFSDLASSDFEDNREMIAAGEAAARAAVARLRELAGSPEHYAAWDARRTRLVRVDNAVTVADVRVQGLKTVNPQAVLAEVDLPRDRPITTREIERAAQQLWGSGDFEAVNYSLIGPADAPVLVFTPYEKSWGYNTLRFGGRVQTNFREASTFNGLVAHTWRWLNDWGAEWRNEVQIGDTRGLATEWFQPLGAGSPWFVLPRLSYTRTEVEVFQRGNDTPVAVASTTEADAGVALGYTIGRKGYASLGRTRTMLDGELVVSPVPGLSAREYGTSWDAKLVIDTLDSVSFPRTGSLLRVTLRDFGRRIEGTERSRSALVGALTAYTFERWTVLFNGEVGRSVQAGSFRLGGLFNLSGTPTGSVAGSRLALVSATGFRNVSDAFGDLRVPIYLGASLETGNAVDASERLGLSSAKRAAALFVAGDTPLGPVYLAYGRTFGGRSAVYLFWGRFQ